MKNKNERPSTKVKPSDFHSFILNSGIFLRDNSEKPIGIFKLQGDNKNLCKEDRNVLSDITELALRDMIRKLDSKIFAYLHDPPDFQKLQKEYFEMFEPEFLKFLGNWGFQKDELDPQYSEFLRKVHRKLKKKVQEWWPSKVPTKAHILFWHLINPLYGIFEKYLTDLETKECVISQDEIFHYIAHLLIACDIEAPDNKRGQWPIYEKIKRYAHRSNHVKYMGHARPYGTWE